MLRVLVKPHPTASSTYGNNVEKNVQLGDLIKFTKEFEKRDEQMFPLSVTMIGLGDRGAQLFPKEISFVVFASETDVAAYKKNLARHINDNNVTLQVRCCFVRQLEDLYCRFIGRYPSYKRGMSIADARIARENVLGMDCCYHFCWDKSKYGDTPSTMYSDFPLYRQLCGQHLSRIPVAIAEEDRRRFTNALDDYLEAGKYEEDLRREKPHLFANPALTDRTSRFRIPLDAHVNHTPEKPLVIPTAGAKPLKQALLEREGKKEFPVKRSLATKDFNSPKIAPETSEKDNLDHSLSSKPKTSSDDSSPFKLMLTGSWPASGHSAGPISSASASASIETVSSMSSAYQRSTDEHTIRNAPVADWTEVRWLLKKYRMNPLLEIKHEALYHIDEGYFVPSDATQPGAGMMITPRALKLLGDLSITTDYLVIARDWYSANYKGGLPVLTLPAGEQEFEMTIRRMPTDRLKLVYDLARSCKSKQLACQNRSTCEQCNDRSHSSDECVRFMSYEARVLNVILKGGCVGCGNKECAVGNGHHLKTLNDVCQKCGANESPKQRLHKNFLCTDSIRWGMKRRLLIGLACLAKATWHWSERDFSKFTDPNNKDLPSSNNLFVRKP